LPSPSCRKPFPTKSVVVELPRAEAAKREGVAARRVNGGFGSTPVVRRCSRERLERVDGGPQR
jgi:hypothetical protein